MTNSDFELLEAIKNEIARQCGLLGNTNWSQKDYDFLSFYIEEQGGYRLSVSTLKRLWSKQYTRLPHISTLDVLARVAFKADWQSLKAERLSHRGRKKKSVPKLKRLWKPIGLLLAVILPLILLFAAGIRTFEKKKNRRVEVDFSFKKTLSNELPNTVVFNYDIEGLEAERFYLQQSWDKSRRVEIFKGSTERTDIYYIPGYFTAKLLADEQVIKEIPVHITHEDWFIAMRQPMSNIVTFGKELWEKQDYLALKASTIQTKGIDLNQEFQQAFYQVRDFGLQGDNFTHSVAFSMEALEAVDCPLISIHVQGTSGYYWVMLGNKGCGAELGVKVGEKEHHGKTEDLTMLATQMYQWNRVKLQTVDKQVNLTLNDTLVFSTAYEESIGAVMEISYFFNGIGKIDDVLLANKEKEVVFADNFDD